MRNIFFKLMAASTLIAIAGCSRNIDDTLSGARGIIKLNDNGPIEQGVCYLWETITGHRLGASIEDILNDREVDMKLLVIMLQNYVEKAHELGASREGAIEKLLVEAGYDNKFDGRIRIPKITKEEVRERLRHVEKMKKAYLKHMKD